MKLHLETLTIERFRGLRDLELKDCRKVNLFVGVNNSGKTSVLEAIAVYCQPLDPLEWLSTSRRREALGSRLPVARLNTLRWLFPQSADIERNVDENYSGRIQIRAIGEYVVRSMDASYQEIRGIPDKTTLESMTWRFQSREPDATYRGAELRVTVNGDGEITSPAQPASPQSTQTYTFWDMARYRRKQRPPDALPVKTITPVSHRTDLAVERYSEVVFRRQTESLLELVRLFDPGIVGMQILGGEISDLYLEHRESGLTPLSAFGDGVRRAVIVALTLPSIGNGVLLIDEIETAIHITVLNEVYRWLLKACQRLNVQLFATTHSLEAVDALLKAHTEPYDDLALYQLGHLGAPAKRFSGELLNRLLVERGLDVR